jgi:hypothetical protein
MNKVTDFLRWVSSNFFYITIAVLISLYVWWFRLNPIVSGPGEQAAAPLIFGLILLLIYIFSVGMLKLLHRHLFIRAVFFLIAIFFLATNVVLTFFYFPRLQASARFGNTTYYITSNLPFLECCGYHQFTKWEGMSHYESNFYRYNMPQVKFIYDKKTDEVSLVDVSEGFEKLYETFGKSHRSYEGYAKLGNRLYYSSAKCNRNEEGVCETWTYILYQCELDNTSCIVLPIEYTTGMDGWVNLQTNLSRNEIEFYFEKYFSADDGTLIYTYGQSPRCFADGCSLVR